MAIVQISKIQHRTGNLIDLPQLSDAELGWASDANRLFIGTTPPQNIEVLTSYSSISFSQIDGSSNANLNLSNVVNGQVMAYDTTTTSWTNKGGNASDPGNATYYTNTNIHLGNVSNVKIGGGVNGYVLQTDGSGNLNWTEQIAGTPGNGLPGGANTQIQYNDGGFFGGTSGFTFDKVSGAVMLPGTLNVSNTITGTRLISNIATGTAPLTVTSTTQVANLNAATAGTVITAAQPNITSVGTLTSLAVTGNANVGNLNTAGTVIASQVSANSSGLGTNFKVGDDMFIGDINIADTMVVKGQQDGANGYIVFGNADTTSTLGRSGTGPLTYLGAFTATGNGTFGNVSATTFTGALSGAATTAGTVTTNAQPNITSVGTLTSLSVTGNITSGNAALGNLVTANFFSGSGNNLSNIQGANITGQVGNALVAGTVYTNAQPNITSVGTLTTLGVNGTITAVAFTANTGVFTGNGSGLTNLAGGNITGQVANALVASTVYTNAQPNITSVSTSFTSLTFANAQAITGNNLSLSTGANTNAGTITGNWSLTAGSQLRATYADLAEYYEADQQYEPGTVLEFGGDKEVTIAEDGTARVAGIVTTNPAYVMNQCCKGFAVAIALQGRVPTKVRGTIRKGDMMVSAGNGYARPWNNPQMGTVIGKALENFDGIEGVIEVAVGRL